jgi:hypothetical protein
VQTYPHQKFPALGAYSKFVEATNRYSVELRALLALMLHRNRHTQGAYPIVLQDSTAIEVCHVARVRQHRTFRDWARKSKNGMGWWYGFKLHVQCDDAGRRCGVELTTATVEDRTLLDPFTRWMKDGIVVGDGSYLSRAKAKELGARRVFADRDPQEYAPCRQPVPARLSTVAPPGGGNFRVSQDCLRRSSHDASRCICPPYSLAMLFIGLFPLQVLDRLSDFAGNRVIH